MKKVNDITIYEENDPCSLDEYSQELEKDLSTKFKKVSDEKELQDKEIEILKNKDNKQDKLILELQKENAILKEENKNIKNQIPKGTASGNSIHIEDSSDLEMEWVLRGGSKQETRESKNKLSFNDFITQTINGLTVTNNKDGSFTLNGTTTDSVSTRISDKNKNLKAGNYYLSRNSSGAVSEAFSTVLYGSNGTPKDIINVTSEESKLTNTVDYEEVYLWLYIAKAGVTFTNYILKVQLESGEVKTPWELYGAMPSPKYPSKIEAVGQNINLLNDNSFKGIVISNYNNDVTVDFSMKGNKTYISRIYFTDGTVANTNNIAMIAEDANGATKSTLNLDSRTPTVENANAVTKVRLYVNTAGKTEYAEKVIKGIKIEEIKSGTKATPYSPYGMGSVEIKTYNKNILPNNIEFYNNNTSDFTGTANSIANRVRTNSFEIVGNETYTLSGLVGKTQLLNVRIFDKNKVFLGDKNNILLNGNMFTLPNNVKYINFLFKNSDDSELFRLNVADMNIQLEVGDVATDYIEHESDSVIMPTQKTMLEDDCIDDKEHHSWNKLILTGNENFEYSQTSSGINRFALVLSDNLVNSVVISNSYVGSLNNQYYSVYVGGNNKLYICDSYTSVTDFKAKLQELYNAGTPVEIYYKLAEAEELELTEEQKQARAKILKTYKNVTNISVDNELASVDVTYYKDQETENKKLQTQIDEIKALLTTTRTSAMLLDNMQTDLESEVK